MADKNDQGQDQGDKRIRVVQILNSRIHLIFPDGQYKNAAQARKFYHKSIQLEDAPLWVQIDYPYDGSKSGDDRYTRPTVPEGWRLDEESGTLYNPSVTRESERTAIYAELDGESINLIRKITLGIDTAASKKRLQEIHDYHEAVRKTQDAKGYPDYVEYPAKIGDSQGGNSNKQ